VTSAMILFVFQLIANLGIVPRGSLMVRQVFINFQPIGNKRCILVKRIFFHLKHFFVKDDCLKLVINKI